MRSHRYSKVLGFVLLAVFSVAFVGCGDDDSPTGNTIGSLTDPNFVAVQEQVEMYVDSTMDYILTGFSSMSSISSGGNVDPVLYGPVYPDSDQVTITYVGGWHVVNLTKSRYNYAFNILDSVQFYSNDAVSQTSDNLDSMWYRHNWLFGMPDTTDSHLTMEGASGFDFRNLQSSAAVIDGSQDLNVYVKHVTNDSTVWRNFDQTSTVNDLVVSKGGSNAWDEVRPTSGTLHSTITVNYYNDATQVDSETIWTVTVVFVNGDYNVSITQGTTTWSYNSTL